MLEYFKNMYARVTSFVAEKTGLSALSTFINGQLPSGTNAIMGTSNAKPTEVKAGEDTSAIEEVDSPSVQRAKQKLSQPTETALAPYGRSFTAEQQENAKKFVQRIVQACNREMLLRLLRSQEFAKTYTLDVTAARRGGLIKLIKPAEATPSSESIFDDLFSINSEDNKVKTPVAIAAGSEAKKEEAKVQDESNASAEKQSEAKTELPGPNVQDTPVYAALKTEVERLEAKASQAWGIEGFIWKSNYAAKAAEARAALTAIEAEHDSSKAMDDLIAEKIADTNSDMYKALNTHSSYVCQFTVAPTSWKARALINIEKAIEDNNPAAENLETPAATASA